MSRYKIHRFIILAVLVTLCSCSQESNKPWLTRDELLSKYNCGEVIHSPEFSGKCRETFTFCSPQNAPLHGSFKNSPRSKEIEFYYPAVEEGYTEAVILENENNEFFHIAVVHKTESSNEEL